MNFQKGEKVSSTVGPDGVYVESIGKDVLIKTKDMKKLPAHALTSSNGKSAIYLSKRRDVIPLDSDLIQLNSSTTKEEMLEICNSIKPGISKGHQAAAEKKLNKVSSKDLQVGQEYYIYDDNGRARNYYKYGQLKRTTSQYPRNFDIFLKGTFVKRYKENVNHGWIGEFKNIKLLCQKAYSPRDIEYWKNKETYDVALERGVIFGKPNIANDYAVTSAANVVRNSLGLPIENVSMVTDFLPKGTIRSRSTKKGGKRKQRRTQRKKTKRSRK